jgi:hypothetical protein
MNWDVFLNVAIPVSWKDIPDIPIETTFEGFFYEISMNRLNIYIHIWFYDYGSKPFYAKVGTLLFKFQ